MAAAAADRELPPQDRLDGIAQWLTDGQIPETYVSAAETRAMALWVAVSTRAARFDTAADGRIAVVTGETDGLLRLGYYLAPVVIAFNPAHRYHGGASYAKFTIAQYRAGYVDLVGAAAELA